MSNRRKPTAANRELFIMTFRLCNCQCNQHSLLRMSLTLEDFNLQFEDGIFIPIIRDHAEGGAGGGFSPPPDFCAKK